MTQNQFEKLSVGDIVSHPNAPWARWVIFSYNKTDNPETGTNVCFFYAIQPITREITRMSSPTGWEIVSKVTSRENYE